MQQRYLLNGKFLEKMYGKVIVIKRTGADGAHFPLVGTTCKFGRSLECDIRIQLPSVSREHCTLTIDNDGRAFINNNSQVNPITVNGTIVLDSHRLGHADVITITNRAFRFEFVPGSKHFPSKTLKSPKTPGKSPGKSPSKVLTPKDKPPTPGSTKKTSLGRAKKPLSPRSDNVIPSTPEMPLKGKGTVAGRSSKGKTPPTSPSKVSDPFDSLLDGLSPTTFYQKSTPSRARSGPVMSTIAVFPASMVASPKELGKTPLTTGKMSPGSPFIPKSKELHKSISDLRRKSQPVQEENVSPRAAFMKKRVSFGPKLSPEQFDRNMPPKTPIKKGATPRRSLPAPSPAVSRRSLAAIPIQEEASPDIFASQTTRKRKSDTPDTQSAKKAKLSTLTITSPSQKTPSMKKAAASPKTKNSPSPTVKKPKSPMALAATPLSATSALAEMASDTKVPVKKTPSKIVSVTPVLAMKMPTRSPVTSPKSGRNSTVTTSESVFESVTPVPTTKTPKKTPAKSPESRLRSRSTSPVKTPAKPTPRMSLSASPRRRSANTVMTSAKPTPSLSLIGSPRSRLTSPDKTPTKQTLNKSPASSSRNTSPSKTPASLKKTPAKRTPSKSPIRSMSGNNSYVESQSEAIATSVAASVSPVTITRNRSLSSGATSPSPSKTSKVQQILTPGRGRSATKKTAKLATLVSASEVSPPQTPVKSPSPVKAVKNVQASSKKTITARSPSPSKAAKSTPISSRKTPAARSPSPSKAFQSTPTSSKKTPAARSPSPSKAVQSTSTSSKKTPAARSPSPSKAVQSTPISSKKTPAARSPSQPTSSKKSPSPSKAVKSTPTSNKTLAARSPSPSKAVQGTPISSKENPITPAVLRSETVESTSGVPNNPVSLKKTRGKKTPVRLGSSSGRATPSRKTEAIVESKVQSPRTRKSKRPHTVSPSQNPATANKTAPSEDSGDAPIAKRRRIEAATPSPIGLKRITKTPKTKAVVASPSGVARMMKTPKQAKQVPATPSPSGLARLVKTPKSPKIKSASPSPKGLKRLMKTPKSKVKPTTATPSPSGLARLIRTPKAPKTTGLATPSPVGLQRLMKTPTSSKPMSPSPKDEHTLKSAASPKVVPAHAGDLDQGPEPEIAKKTPGKSPVTSPRRQRASPSQTPVSVKKTPAKKSPVKSPRNQTSSPTKTPAKPDTSKSPVTRPRSNSPQKTPALQIPETKQVPAETTPLSNNTVTPKTSQKVTPSSAKALKVHKSASPIGLKRLMTPKSGKKENKKLAGLSSLFKTPNTGAAPTAKTLTKSGKKTLIEIAQVLSPHGGRIAKNGDLKKLVALRAIHGKTITPRLSEVQASATPKFETPKTPKVPSPKPSGTKPGTPKSKKKKTPGKKLWSDIVKGGIGVTRPGPVQKATPPKKAVKKIAAPKSAKKTIFGKTPKTPRTLARLTAPTTGHADSPDTIVVGRKASGARGTTPKRKSLALAGRASFERLDTPTQHALYAELPDTPDGPGEMIVSPLSAAKSGGKKASRKSANLVGVRGLFKQTKSPKEVRLSGVQRLISSPRMKGKRSPRLSGVARIMKSPKQKVAPFASSPSGVQRLFATPEVAKARAPTATKAPTPILVSSPRTKGKHSPRLSGVARIMKSPKQKVALFASSPSGVQRLFATPEVAKAKAPTAAKASIPILDSSPRTKDKHSPRLSGVARIMKSPKQTMAAFASSPFGFQHLFATAEVAKAKAPTPAKTEYQEAAPSVAVKVKFDETTMSVKSPAKQASLKKVASPLLKKAVLVSSPVARRGRSRAAKSPAKPQSPVVKRAGRSRPEPIASPAKNTTKHEGVKEMVTVTPAKSPKSRLVAKQGRLTRTAVEEVIVKSPQAVAAESPVVTKKTTRAKAAAVLSPPKPKAAARGSKKGGKASLVKKSAKSASVVASDPESEFPPEHVAEALPEPVADTAISCKKKGGRKVTADVKSPVASPPRSRGRATRSRKAPSPVKPTSPAAPKRGVKRTASPTSPAQPPAKKAAVAKTEAVAEPSSAPAPTRQSTRAAEPASPVRVTTPAKPTRGRGRAAAAKPASPKKPASSKAKRMASPPPHEEPSIKKAQGKAITSPPPHEESSIKKAQGKAITMASPAPVGSPKPNRRTIKKAQGKAITMASPASVSSPKPNRRTKAAVASPIKAAPATPVEKQTTHEGNKGVSHAKKAAKSPSKEASSAGKRATRGKATDYTSPEKTASPLPEDKPAKMARGRARGKKAVTPNISTPTSVQKGVRGKIASVPSPVKACPASKELNHGKAAARSTSPVKIAPATCIGKKATRGKAVAGTTTSPMKKAASPAFLGKKQSHRKAAVIGADLVEASFVTEKPAGKTAAAKTSPVKAIPTTQKKATGVKAAEASIPASPVKATRGKRAASPTKASAAKRVKTVAVDTSPAAPKATRSTRGKLASPAAKKGSKTVKASPVAARTTRRKR